MEIDPDAFNREGDRIRRLARAGHIRQRQVAIGRRNPERRLTRRLTPSRSHQLRLISGSRTIQDTPAGTPADSKDTPRFAELSGVRPMIETYSPEKAGEAYARTIRNSKQPENKMNGRGGAIRTPDPLRPRQVRYQAALRPDIKGFRMNQLAFQREFRENGKRICQAQLHLPSQHCQS